MEILILKVGYTKNFSVSLHINGPTLLVLLLFITIINKFQFDNYRDEELPEYYTYLNYCSHCDYYRCHWHTVLAKYPLIIFRYPLFLLIWDIIVDYCDILSHNTRSYLFLQAQSILFHYQLVQQLNSQPQNVKKTWLNNCHIFWIYFLALFLGHDQMCRWCKG